MILYIMFAQSIHILV